MQEVKQIRSEEVFLDESAKDDAPTTIEEENDSRGTEKPPPREEKSKHSSLDLEIQNSCTFPGDCLAAAALLPPRTVGVMLIGLTMT